MPFPFEEEAETEYEGHLENVCGAIKVRRSATRERAEAGATPRPLRPPAGVFSPLRPKDIRSSGGVGRERSETEIERPSFHRAHPCTAVSAQILRGCLFFHFFGEFLT